MAVFRYQVARDDGQVHEGRIDAQDRDSAARELQARGDIPIRIEPDSATSSDALTGTPRKFGKTRSTQAAIDFFTLELATLLKAGLPLAEALDTMTGLADNPAMARIAQAVNRAVRGGKPLSTALQEADPGFDRFYCNMVRAGESSGALDATLERLAAFRASRRETREAVVSALIYPVILLVLAFAAVAVLLGFVVPQFTTMFADAGRDLPLLTRIVTAVGTLIADWWWLILVGFGLVFWLLRRDWQSAAGRARWEGILLKTALVGPLLRQIYTARFARTLGTLLENGVHLVPAMELSKDVVGNSLVTQALSDAARRVREGTALATAIDAAAVFPGLAVQFVRLGEKSGRLHVMLAQLADIYERDTRVSLKRLLTLLEPTIIIFIALLVAVIILSVVLMILESNSLAF